MDGEMRFQSREGEGSRFSFVIPVQVDSEQAPLVTDAEREKGVTAESHGIRALGLNVLLAEDNPVNQEVAVAILESLQCQVELVANGREAVERAPAGFDVILMDCQMPEMDGLQATRKIREEGILSEKGTTIPIVAVTAHAMRHDREACFAAGMDGYVSKPFGRDQLFTALSRWADADTAPLDFTPQKPTAKPIDPAPLRELASLPTPDPAAFLEQLFEKYRASAEKLLVDIQQGAENEDAEAVWRSAHALKSSSAQLGAQYVAKIAKDIEMAGRADEMDAMSERVDHLESALHTALAALSDLEPSEILP